MKDIHYGDHMTMESFIKAVECGALIDYDGFGNYANETKVSDEVISPSDVIKKKIKRGYTHVVWYNR